jgi:hypothetical protein
MDNEGLTLDEKELNYYVEALDVAEETWEKDKKARRGRKKKDENNTL